MTFRALGAEVRRMHCAEARPVRDIARLLGVQARLVRRLLHCPVSLRGAWITDNSLPLVRGLVTRRPGE